MILKDIYVDDLLTGFDDVQVLTERKDEIIKILKSAKFQLRKWVSNEPSNLMIANSDSCPMDVLQVGKEFKTLGILWDPVNDVLSYKIGTFDSSMKPTKRNILSTVSQILRPFGSTWSNYYKSKNFITKALDFTTIMGRVYSSRPSHCLGSISARSSMHWRNYNTSSRFIKQVSTFGGTRIL